MSFRRFSGLDRSGPPPPETQPGAPLRPWTIPNAIGYLRLALIPVFLVLAWGSDGVSFWSAFTFGAIAVGAPKLRPHCICADSAASTEGCPCPSTRGPHEQT